LQPRWPAVYGEIMSLAVANLTLPPAAAGDGLSCEGKWAIHPNQTSPANTSSGEAEVTRAKRIRAAMGEAAKAGKGAVSLAGRLIDYASVRWAEVG
jgi:malyl-CoA/(S)-citramalyl-CoA lyase